MTIDNFDESTLETEPVPQGDGCTTGACSHPDHHHGYILEKQRYLTRLRRIEGQARGIHKMVDEDRYCIDILTQISALTKALEGVAVGLLEDHVRHCVVDAAAAGDPDEKIAEVTNAIRRLL